MKTAFLGLGRMGQAMATRLVQAGFPLTVWNRNPEKCAPLQGLGAATADSPAGAVQNAEVVFTMLADDDSLREVMAGDTVAAMAPDGVHVSMSTIGVALASEMAEAHADLGRGYLSCPVFGRPDAAASGALRLCLSGPRALKEKVLPLLPPMGEVRDFGESPAAAAAVKLVGNFMIATTIELMGEAFSLAEKHGIAPDQFYELISSTIFASPIVKNYGRVILEADFGNPGFTARLGAKDVRLVREAARMTDTPLPLASLLEDRFARLLARGWGDQDWTIVSKAQRQDAGLE